MKDKKIATSLLALTLVSGALVVGPIHADAATKVKSVTTSSSLISKKGKLVFKKTGEIVKGYATFNGKVYRNGVKFTGVLNSK